MRIILVISSLNAGGAERILSVMANYWVRKRKWQVTLLTFDDGQTPPFYPLDPGVDYRPLNIARPSSSSLYAIINNLRRIVVLRKVLGSMKPTAVIAFMDKTNILVLLSAIGLGLSIIVSERSDPQMQLNGFIWSPIRNLIYPTASAIVVQSESIKQFFSRRIQSKCHVIPNPISVPAKYVKNYREVQNKKANVVLAIGRLSEEKGFDFLIEAFARIANENLEWHLKILGEAPLRSKLEQYIQQLKLTHRISMPGITRSPYREMQQADLFILSSRYEGFPNVLCEAMACGLPVISFDCLSGPGQIIRNGTDGILVPVGDVNALGAAMKELMADESKRTDLAAQALAVRDRFALEKIMDMWELLV